jgi:hypothetical protein
VDADLGNDLKGKVFTLTDDDERFMAEVGLPPILPADSWSTAAVNAVGPIYSKAYVQVIDVNALGWNTRKSVSFDLNYYSKFGDNLFNSSKDLSDSPIFWEHTVTFAFQTNDLFESDGESKF